MSKIGKSKVNAWHFQVIVDHNFSILRGKLLNLADAISEDKEKREATKGLIRDFTGESFNRVADEIEELMKALNVIPEGDGQGIESKTLKL